MQRLAAVSDGAAVLALLVLASSLLATFWLGLRAETAQRVVPHDEATAALLGEVGTPVGGVREYIVFDRDAFLETPIDGGDVRLLDETYLRDNGVYPWQMKTVRFARTVFASASALAAVVLIGLGRYARGRAAKREGARTPRP